VESEASADRKRQAREKGPPNPASANIFAEGGGKKRGGTGDRSPPKKKEERTAPLPFRKFGGTYKRRDLRGTEREHIRDAQEKKGREEHRGSAVRWNHERGGGEITKGTPNSACANSNDQEGGASISKRRKKGTANLLHFSKKKKKGTIEFPRAARRHIIRREDKSASGGEKKGRSLQGEEKEKRTRR